MDSREQQIEDLKEELRDLGDRIRVARFIHEHAHANQLRQERDQKLDTLFALIG